MTIHNMHDSMPDGAVLADGCERCKEHSEHPFDSLDDGNISKLTKIALDFSADVATINDARAAKYIERTILEYRRIQRLGLVD